MADLESEISLEERDNRELEVSEKYSIYTAAEALVVGAEYNWRLDTYDDPEGIQFKQWIERPALDGEGKVDERLKPIWDVFENEPLDREIEEAIGSSNKWDVCKWAVANLSKALKEEGILQSLVNSSEEDRERVTELINSSDLKMQMIHYLKHREKAVALRKGLRVEEERLGDVKELMELCGILALQFPE